MEVKWGLKTLDLKTVPEICKEFPISETCLYGLIHKKKVPFWECGRKYLLNLPDVISALHVPVETNGVDSETERPISETDPGQKESIQGSAHEVSAGQPGTIEEHFDDPEQEVEDEEFYAYPDIEDTEDPDGEVEIRDDEIELGEDVDLDLPEDPELPDEDSPEEIASNQGPLVTRALQTEEDFKFFLEDAPERCNWTFDADGNLVA